MWKSLCYRQLQRHARIGWNKAHSERTYRNQRASRWVWTMQTQAPLFSEWAAGTSDPWKLSWLEGQSHRRHEVYHQRAFLRVWDMWELQAPGSTAHNRVQLLPSTSTGLLGHFLDIQGLHPMQIPIPSPHEVAVWPKVNQQRVLRRQRAMLGSCRAHVKYLLLCFSCSNLCQVTTAYLACVFLGEGQCYTHFMD